jgi:soluble lytic murein transglycosylase
MRRWKIVAVVVSLGLLDAAALGWLYLRHQENRHNTVIFQAARRYGVDPSLAKAVVWCESRFDTHARGRAGELGLMQIRPPAASEWAGAQGLERFHFDHLTDPATNAAVGCWYLSRLLSRYRHTSNPITFALADYNAGRTHVLRWAKGPAATNSELFLEQIDFPGTQRYIQAVVRRSKRYRDQ